jgi:hypothetical protein
LSHHFQHRALEFWKFVQEQDAVMTEGYFSGLRVSTPTDQGYVADRVVRGSKRSAGYNGGMLR